MECEQCNSENISLKERWWAYDWWLTYYCRKCDKEFHRLWGEIIKAYQPEQYWDVLFVTEDEIYINKQIATWNTADWRNFRLIDMDKQHISNILRDVSKASLSINPAYRAYFNYITNDSIYDYK